MTAKALRSGSVFTQLKKPLLVFMLLTVAFSGTVLTFAVEPAYAQTASANALDKGTGGGNATDNCGYFSGWSYCAAMAFDAIMRGFYNLVGILTTIAGSLLDNSIRFSLDRKSTRLNSSHQIISYAVFCLK